MMAFFTIALAAALVATNPASGLVELERNLENAQSHCDLEVAVTTQVSARAAHAEAGSEASGLVLARASLLVAELLRFDYESCDRKDREARLNLGRRIDAAAREGLTTCDELVESSTRQRLRADLLATMIRSKMRAKKYQHDLKAAAARALELDPDNPLAMVSAAKPLVFADAAHGGDPAAAMELLDRALSHDPGLVSALLIRSAAHELLGNAEGAEKDLAAAHALVPDCPPQRIRLPADH